MEGRFNLVAFMALLVAAAMLHSSSAQTRHVVGDSMGWIIPPGGDAAYRSWAANQTFSVGDVLVFNFNTGRHDVAEVTRASYDSCTDANPISLSNNGPTTITLTSAGEHHYICTIGSHCESGQKLSINVVSAGPAPQPATQPPAAAPRPSTPPPVVAPTLPPSATQPPAAAPRPSTPPPAVAPSPSGGAATTHIVGDSLGWTVPPPAGGPVTYTNWARGQAFAVGDVLVFNFPSNTHDVLEVTRAEFDSCSVSTTTTAPTLNGPARVPLSSAGEHYYICTIGSHCSLGQKLAINVTSGGTNPTNPSPVPSSSGTPSPNSGNPVTPFTPSAPPPSSAPSLTVAALPLALLAAALAFLHY